MTRTTLSHTGQPAVKTALAFALGIYLSRVLPLPPRALFASCTALLAAAFLVRLRRGAGDGALSFLLLLLVAGAGSFWTTYREAREPDTPAWIYDIATPVRICGTVAEEPVRGTERVTLLLRTDSIGIGGRSVMVGGLALATEYTEGASVLTSLHTGDAIRMTGKFRLPDGARNPGEFDYRVYLRARGIHHLVTLGADAGIRLLSGGRPDLFQRSLIASRAFLRSRIDALLPPEQAAFVRGLVLGDRALLAPRIQDAFVRAGVVHVLSISGLHVGMIALILLALLSRLPLGVRVWTTNALLLFYLFLTGGDPPVVRSVLMSAVYLVGLQTQRQLSQMNNLAVAALIVLLIRPLELFMVGFQLSFAGVFSLLFFYPRMLRLLRHAPASFMKLPAIRSILQTVLLTLAAQLGTTPILLFHFGQLSVISPIANIVVVPGTFVILSASLAAIFTVDLCAPIAALYASACRGTLDGIVGFTERLAALPFASADIPRPTAWECVLASLLLLYLFHGSKRTTVFRLSSVLLGGAAVLAIRSAVSVVVPGPNILRMTMLDVGQGDAIDVALPRGGHLLVDTGPVGRRNDAGTRTILPYYRRMGIRRLDALILTHPDADHIGGAISVLRGMAVDRLLISPAFGCTAAADSLLREAASRGTLVERHSTGDILFRDRCFRLYLLHPPRSYLPSRAVGEESPSNQLSLALRMVYGRTSFLLAGDLPASGEERVARAFGSFLHCDVLKVGHHGSISSTSPEFLRLIHPVVALISCGKFNRFHHPRIEILARLRRSAVAVRRSDREGAIILESDGEKVSTVDWK